MNILCILSPVAAALYSMYLDNDKQNSLNEDGDSKWPHQPEKYFDETSNDHHSCDIDGKSAYSFLVSDLEQLREKTINR